MEFLSFLCFCDVTRQITFFLQVFGFFYFLLIFSPFFSYLESPGVIAMPCTALKSSGADCLDYAAFCIPADPVLLPRPRYWSVVKLCVHCHLSTSCNGLWPEMLTVKDSFLGSFVKQGNSFVHQYITRVTTC